MENCNKGDRLIDLIPIISMGSGSLVRQINRRKLSQKLAYAQIYVSIIIGISGSKLLWSKSPDLVLFAIMSYIIFFIKLWIYDGYITNHDNMENAINITNTKLGIHADLDNDRLKEPIEKLIKYKKFSRYRTTLIYILLAIVAIINAFVLGIEPKLSLFLVLMVICDIYHIVSIGILNDQTECLIEDSKKYSKAVSSFLEKYSIEEIGAE